MSDDSEISINGRQVLTGWWADVAFYAAIGFIFLAGFVVGVALV